MWNILKVNKFFVIWNLCFSYKKYNVLKVTYTTWGPYELSQFSNIWLYSWHNIEIAKRNNNNNNYNNNKLNKIIYKKWYKLYLCI